MNGWPRRRRSATYQSIARVSILWHWASDALYWLLSCLGKERNLWGRLHKAAIELCSFDFSEVNGHRVLSRLIVVDVAHAVRGQVGMAGLMICNLDVAFVQTDAILNEEQGLIIVQ